MLVLLVIGIAAWLFAYFPTNRRVEDILPYYQDDNCIESLLYNRLCKNTAYKVYRSFNGGFNIDEYPDNPKYLYIVVIDFPDSRDMQREESLLLEQIHEMKKTVSIENNHLYQDLEGAQWSLPNIKTSCDPGDFVFLRGWEFKRSIAFLVRHGYHDIIVVNFYSKEGKGRVVLCTWLSDQSNNMGPSE